MDVPPPSSRDLNLHSFNEEQQQQQQQLRQVPQSASLMGDSTTGATDYIAAGHKYTLSTCATTASGPSTSQTWISGPGTVQINNNLLRETASITNPSTQGSSTRISPVDMPQQSTFANSTQQQTMSTSQWESQSIRTSQNNQGRSSQAIFESQDVNIKTSVIPEVNVESDAKKFEIVKGPPSMSNVQQTASKTQWTMDYGNDLYTNNAASAGQSVTALTSFDNRDNSANSAIRSSMISTTAKVDDKRSTPMDYYAKALDNLNPAQIQTSRHSSAQGAIESGSTIANRQSSGIVNVGPSGTYADPQGTTTNQSRRFITGEPRESVRTISHQLDYDNQKVSENVVRREYGEMRVVSSQERREDSRKYVKSERFVTYEVTVPKRVTREEIVEKVVVEQEKKLVDEVIQESYTVKERIVEWARPRIIEKVIEEPETVYSETTINVVETIQKPVYKKVEFDQVQERVIEKPVIVKKEKPYDVIETKERIVPYERVVEVPVTVDKEVVVEKPVPQYIDVPTAVPVEKEVLVDVTRTIPVCVEAETVCELQVPEIKPRYKKIAYPVYLPKFIEVPMALDLMTDSLQQESTEFVSKINGFTKTAASLCDIENLASNIMRMDHGTTSANLMSPGNLEAAVIKAWNESNLEANTSKGHYQIGATPAGATTSTTVASSGQYVSSTYASTRNYKSDISQPIVAVS